MLSTARPFRGAIPAMTYRDLIISLSRRFRLRRLLAFKAAFPPATYCKVLDLGGSPATWSAIDYRAEITMVNLDPVMMNGTDSFHRVVADARRLPFLDKSFDLVFSNSVIEPKDAEAFANETQRVGRAYYCQTPNKWFPIEPHYGVLLLHWFPRVLHNYYVFRYLTLKGLLEKPNRELVSKLLGDVRLLTRKELSRLFPAASIHVEHVLFWPKSYIAVFTSSAD
jgi:hypothetical protein